MQFLNNAHLSMRLAEALHDVTMLDLLRQIIYYSLKNSTAEWLALLRHIVEALHYISARRQAVSPSRQCGDSTLRLGHDRYLPYGFQFIIH
jgi:hypothetical protein